MKKCVQDKFDLLKSDLNTFNVLKFALGRTF